MLWEKTPLSIYSVLAAGGRGQSLEAKATLSWAPNSHGKSYRRRMNERKQTQARSRRILVPHRDGWNTKLPRYEAVKIKSLIWPEWFIYLPSWKCGNDQEFLGLLLCQSLTFQFWGDEWVGRVSLLWGWTQRFIRICESSLSPKAGFAGWALHSQEYPAILERKTKHLSVSREIRSRTGQHWFISPGRARDLGACVPSCVLRASTSVWHTGDLL